MWRILDVGPPEGFGIDLRLDFSEVWTVEPAE
jgi:hypothetical protein